MPDLVGDVTMRALSQALTGLSMRQRTIADNMANVDTPGFLAGKVDFESSLKSALAERIDPRTANLATARSLEPTRANGSNVNLDEESVAGHETLLSTQLATLALTNKFKGLRTAITGSAG